MGFPKGPELLIILVVVLLLFGARKLPELARSLGQSAKELRRGFDEEEETAGDTSESAVRVVSPEPPERPDQPVDPPAVWPFV